jgi:hypothetical protein
MNLYRTYIEKEKGEIKNISFIKEGFVFPAFLFTIVYTLCHRLWRVSGFLLLAFVLILAVSMHVDEELAFALIIGLALYTGLNFANWRVKKLERNKNVEFHGYSIGKNREDARIKFFNELGKKS